MPGVEREANDRQGNWRKEREESDRSFDYRVE